MELIEKILSGIVHSVKDFPLIRNTKYGYALKRFVSGHAGRMIERRKKAEKPSQLIKSYYDLGGDKKNILLIQLPLPENTRQKRVIPLGIASIAAYCHKRLPDLNFAILDCLVHNLSFERIVDAIVAHKWFAIGISYWTVQAPKARLLSQVLRRCMPDTHLVHGGVHPTLCPTECSEYADFIVTHEGEETFAELLENLIKGDSEFDSIKGLMYSRNGELISTGFRDFIKNLDDLPPIAIELLPVEKYKMPLHVTGEERLPIIGSRGCPFECSFCVSPLMWKKRVRWRDPRSVVQEMVKIRDEYNICSFHFWDDNLTLNRDYITGLCEEIISRKLAFSWVALDRADLINRNCDILPLLKKAGCIGIEIGVESANPETFAHIAKNQSFEESRNAIKNLKNAGIAPLYTYMAFNPGETINGYYFQKGFLDEIQADMPWYEYFHPLPFPVYVGQFATPYPGTKFRSDVDKKGVLLLEDDEYLYHRMINFVPHSLLEDIPLRNTDRLGKNEIYICLVAFRQTLFPYFWDNDNLEEVGSKLAFLKGYAEDFFNHATGIHTLKQMALRMQMDKGVTLEQSLRFSAFMAYIMGQMGWIRSAIYERNHAITPRFIKVPKNILAETDYLLGRAGKR